MVLKRQLKEGGEERSERPNKHRNIASTILKGTNYARALQEFVPSLEPLFRKWVREEVDRAIVPFLRPSYNQIECSGSGSRTFQLQFHGDLPHTIFTGSRVMSEDKTPIKVVLYDSTSKTIITSGPLSSVKANILVLDGDFGPEEWTKNEFDKKVVQNREGKRPLVTGELIVHLQNGVGSIGEVIFTDNSSWIRSGKFRLAATATGSHEFSIREGMSNSFKVKDHRGESYQKHYPPCLDDEVWRLEKIAKDGASHKRLSQFGIFSVRDFLRLYVTNQNQLRTRFVNVSNKTWETIIRHAKTCTLDDKKYMYGTAQGTGLLFNSIYEVVGATFDGQTYHSVDTLNIYQKRVVEDLKQYAYKNTKDLLSVSDPSIVGYPMLLASSAPQIFNNFQIEQDQHEVQMNNDHQSISPPYNSEVEQDNCSFELGESSHQMQGFNPAFKNSFEMSDSPVGFYNLASGGYMASQLSTDDLPIEDNFQVESSSAWKGNGFFLGSSNHEIGILSSNSGLVIPRNGRPKARWCMVLAVVKWRILKRNVAAKKMKCFYNYM
ncbi:hypothetical protein BUALT_Bualt19G0068000 [Buddleja alternifolia]|uniref:Calmodulin-binding protein n=1 Tax=Buddleja alternifolia TaxID=168488 RepID=A0AAV6W5J8_9LAMI|nr:hypothetical protein BUALT_Bualt19G0068000 [Buddleja alternifolia]